MINKIENYIKKASDSITINYLDDFTVTVKPFLSIQEEMAFINEVLENSYTYNDFEDKEIYSPISAKVAFELCFLSYFTDIEMIPKTVEVNGEEKEIIDNEKMYVIYCGLNLFETDELKLNIKFISYINRLNGLVNEAIKFKNETLIAQSSIAHANEEAINSFGEVCNGLVKILETANTALEENGGKLIDKVSKLITKDNMNKLLSMLPDDAKDLVGIINKSKNK